MSPVTMDLRQFLTDYFSDEELTTLCFDFFPEVHNSFASGMSKGQKVQLLIEYVQRREQLPDLLKVLQQQRPAQYAKRFGQAEATSAMQPRPVSPAPQSKADAAPAQPVSTVSGGVNLEGQQVSVGKDVVGRDKIIQAGTYIEHATIVQSAPSIQEAKATTQPERQANVHVWGSVEFVRIPAGKFLMGSKDDNNLAQDSEKPQHTVELPYDYWLARYPVTNEQFAKFVEEAAYRFSLDKNWKKKADHPVVNVSWHDGMEYCQWLNTLVRDASQQPSQGLVVRLPTEAEWEKAARGEYGNEWPWGNEFDPRKCNSSEGNKGGTTPVGAYSPQGDSPYGVADMAGDVWEWCHSLYQSYPYRAADGRESEDANAGGRVLRGGAFDYDQRYARAAYRYGNVMGNRNDNVGLRVVVAPVLS